MGMTQSWTQGGVLALVGFMGAGKTTVGRELAERLACRFVDLDREIVRAVGQTIPRIFAERGEEHFRHLEARELRRMLARARMSRRTLVLSLGGGAYAQEVIRCELRRKGAVTAYLSAPVEELRRRIGAAEGRPLAADEQRFRALYERRRGFYEQADWMVASGDRSASEVVAQLVERWRARVGGIR